VYVFLYLITIVAANLSVAYFGPLSTIVNAFLFVGLDLTLRDALHEQWENRNLWLKMGALLVAGSALSWFLNRDAGRIALASMAAFAAAGVADAILFQVLHHRSRFQRVNGSNLLSSLVDSLVFPTIAFGALMPTIVVGQFAAKLLGGFIWSLVLNRFFWNRRANSVH
jgi:uncharacterized PurR-regulated membrane protein YhhQ (DUF165 family)